MMELLLLFSLIITQTVFAIEPIIIVHGGAGDISDDRHEGKNQGTITAVNIAYNVLTETNNVLEAVEAAVRSMELDPNFNCGYGSVLTKEGIVEMDAAIMNGSDLSAGCVAGVRNIYHPITLARDVMDKTVHTFIAGEGVMKLASNLGYEFLEPGALITENALNALKQWWINQNATSEGNKKVSGGTVGAVAIDSKGHIAVATSTGGTTGKLPGRVGDSPIIGAGSYADNRYGGVSATGHGETFMKFSLAHSIIQRINYLNEDAQTATTASLIEMTDKLSGDGGAITIDRNGKIGIYFTSKKMSWAYKKGNCIHYGIARDEDYSICD